MKLQVGVFLCMLAASSGNLLGGMREVDLNEEGVRQVVEWTVLNLNGRMNSLYHHVLLGVSQASRQVVNGYLYHLVLNLAPSSCRNNAENEKKTIEECPFSNNGKIQRCDTTVVDKRGEYTLKTFKCDPVELPSVLGGDDHDYIPHIKEDGKQNLLGGDDHDYIPHIKEDGKQNHLGGDDHDYIPHIKEDGKQHLLGGDDHDYIPHIKEDGKQNLLGGDDHDYIPHIKEDGKQHLLGGDDHDYIPHIKEQDDNKIPLLGGDDHDYIPHIQQQDNKLPLLGRGMHDYLPHLKNQNGVHHMSILGGDDSDYKPHQGDHCLQYAEDFKQFKAKFNRLYGSYREEAKRFQIFCTNMDKVKAYQERESGSARYGATIFADISEEEFRKTHMGFNVDAKHTKVWPRAEIPKGPVPDSFDWRDHNAVTPVKNQESCGSCWAFSTTGNIEGQSAIKHGKLVSLSEQELVDCDKIDEGCNGGLPSQAYESLEKLGGIEKESDYKYNGHDDTCHFNKSKVVIKLSGAVNISQDEKEIAAWLAKNGPISIGINAFAMQFYFGGIAHPWKIFCNPKSLDHGVLIVGYGVKNGEPYWIVKNSWGPGWGEKGYYYVYRGSGVCGLNTMCTSAVVE